MSTLGERLREQRHALGLNQTEFAQIGGVKKETQSNYETGTRRPDSAYLEAIAARGVDVLYVLTGKRSEPPAVALRLREERERLGLSQAELAERAEISVGEQASVERGDVALSDAYLEAIAMADVDVAYVLRGERALMQGYVPPRPASMAGAINASDQSPIKYDDKVVPSVWRTNRPMSAPGAVGTAEDAGGYVLSAAKVVRQITTEEDSLLDSYNTLDQAGRVAVRRVFHALSIAGSMSALVRPKPSQGAATAEPLESVQRYVSSDEVQLLDDFKAADEKGRWLARGVLQAMALTAATYAFVDSPDESEQHDASHRA